jgi:hypothetical protein
MARKILTHYAPPARRFDPKKALDALLSGAATPIAGYAELLPTELDREAATIEADDGLSELGKRRALAKLAEKYHGHEFVDDLYEPWIKKAEAEERRLNEEIARRPARDGLSVAEQVRAEHSHHRRMMDFRALAPEQRRAKVYEAIDKAAASEQARELLQGLVDDGLLDAPTEQRAVAAIRAGAHPAVVRALDELSGTDPARPGALTVARFARAQYHAGGAHVGAAGRGGGRTDAGGRQGANLSVARGGEQCADLPPSQSRGRGQGA